MVSRACTTHPPEHDELEAALESLIGVEHCKLNFFQELQQSVKELQESNRESENRRQEIAAIIDGITDVMMVLSEDLRIIDVNRVFYDLFPGINPVGQFCYTLFRHSDHPCPECPAFRSLSSDSVYKETAFFMINGRNRQFEMIASPLKNPDLPEHRVLIFKRDVTLEKEYQAKFYQAEKMATIGMLAAGVAHEINNPLAAVSGFAEGIRRRLPQMQPCLSQELFDDIQDYTDTILKECLRCQDIVQTLLPFSRTSDAPFHPVDLNAVAQGAIKLITHRIKRYPSLTVELAFEQNLPLLNGDEAQLKQVILNLLTNALDAMQMSGKLTVSTAATTDQTVCLRVQDTGCGVPPEDMDKLFEPFFTTKPAGKGIGIGLSTCFSIVQKHKGTIQVSSTEGKGSQFTVCLPVHSTLSNAAPDSLAP